MKPTAPAPLRRLAAIAATVTVTLMGACGGTAPTSSSGPSFSGAPLQMLHSSAGTFDIAVRTSPAPPIRGVGAAELTITDSKGAPLSGLSLTLVPWMPDMGHGTSVKPTLKEIGGGVYEVDQIGYFMAGRWQLRTHIAIEGSAGDDVAPEFQIQ